MPVTIVVPKTLTDEELAALTKEQKDAKEGEKGIIFLFGLFALLAFVGGVCLLALITGVVVFKNA